MAHTHWPKAQAAALPGYPCAVLLPYQAWAPMPRVGAASLLRAARAHGRVQRVAPGCYRMPPGFAAWAPMGAHPVVTHLRTAR